MLNNDNIRLRTVDAEFIFQMRQNENKTKVTGTVESQKEWIKSYKQRENEKKEFYFVIELKDSEKNV